MTKIKRRHVTLIEMMIVMFLIAMIIGVIAYNYQGSLDEGKAFKTKTGMEKVKTILMLRISENSDALNGIDNHWKEYIANSPLVQNPESLVKDGWGNEYRVGVVNKDGQDEIEVYSQSYTSYLSKHPSSMFGDGKKR